jgi:CubicO group peptidase (beta-lactamase class C family)
VVPAVQFDEAKVDAIFATLDQSRLPGAVAGIAIEGRPVYRKGFGLANMELPVVLSPTMRLRIGSTTKHFTALAYLLLCEEGKAGIDDPIGKFLPELHCVTRGVTARQLMTNTSGLRDSHDICWHFSGTAPLSTSDLLALYRDMDDVNAPPGTAWIYNNGGWSILSVIVERISGQPLEAFLSERIFSPLGMNDTLLRRFDTDFVSNSATLHMTDPAGGYEKAYLGVALAGEGGIVSTVDDMLRWLAHMTDPSVGTAATWQTIKTPHTLSNATSTGYGLGLMSGHYRGVEVLHHPGGVNGGGAQMLRVPAVGLDVVVMVNRHDVFAAQIVDKILDACLHNLAPLEEACERRIVEGVFQSANTGRVVQLHRATRSAFFPRDHQIVSIDGCDLPVIADERGVLRPTAGFDCFKQTVTPLGNPESPHSIELSDFGNGDELAAVRTTAATSARAITGRYRSLVTDTEVTIDSGATVRLRSRGRFGSMEFGLDCLAERIWRARAKRVTPPGGILSFDSDYSGFRFSSARTLSLPFRRVA